MPSPFPCKPAIRECSQKKNPDRKKKQKQKKLALPIFTQAFGKLSVKYL